MNLMSATPTPEQEPKAIPEIKAYPHCPYCDYAIDTKEHPLRLGIAELNPGPEHVENCMFFAVYCGNLECQRLLPMTFFGRKEKSQELRREERPTVIHSGAGALQALKNGRGGARPLPKLDPKLIRRLH